MWITEWNVDNVVKKGARMEDKTMNLPELLAATFDQLKTECVKRGVDASGLKSEVLVRLIENMQVEEKKSVMMPVVDYKRVSKLIPEFDGTGMERFRKRVENIKQEYKCEEEKMKLEIIPKLVGPAKDWFDCSAENVLLSYDELMGKLATLFNVKEDKIKKRRDLEQRKWRAGERLAVYVRAKMMLAEELKLEEEELMEYIIDGVDDTHMKVQLQIAQIRTVRELIDRVGDTEKQRGVQMERQMETEEKREHYRQRRCYRCGDSSHFANVCGMPIHRGMEKTGTAERRECFTCGGNDHLRRNCPVGNNGERRLNIIEGMKLIGNIINVRLFLSNRWKIWSAIVDTGSAISVCLSRVVAGEKWKDWSGKHNYNGVNNSAVKILGTVSPMIEFDGKQREIELKVVEEGTINYDILLGRDFLAKFQGSICFGSRKLEFEETTIDDENDEFEEFLKIEMETQKIGINVNEEVGPRLVSKFNELFTSCYEKGKASNLGFKEENQMTITLNEPIKIQYNPRRLSVLEKEKLHVIIEDLLARGIIRPSQSEYASPIVMVKKKNGEMRLCVDYRDLNKATVKDNFPIPHIEDMIMQLKDKKFFSQIDLKNAYHQIKMNPESIKFTAFTSPMGNYEYIMCPYGLKNGPSVFQRAVHNLLSDLIRKGKVVVYLDDILVPSSTVDENLKVVSEVLRRIRDADFEIRKEKCFFLQTKINFLGYVIQENQIKPTEEGVQGLTDFPVPDSTRKVQSFLGLASYFRKFIRDFSLIAKPLYQLLKKEEKFNFGPAELDAFETLKLKLLSNPVLAIYSPVRETELHTDASKWGFGAILLQRQEDKLFHPVFYFSKRSDEYEQKLHSFEQETLAVVHALKRFRVYLHGINFKIVTDCEALKNTLKKKETSSKIHRWALMLQDYDFILEHRAGEKMQHVDSLSRNAEINVIVENTLEDRLIIAQNRDKELKEVMTQLENQAVPGFELRNGVLYRNINGELLFAVPAQMEQNVIRSCHDDFGHLGIDKTYEFLKRTYWFRNAKDKIKEYIGNCLKCIVYSPDRGRDQGRLYNIPKKQEPFDTIHVDHCGPFNLMGNNKYLFSVIDGFTKFVKLFVTKKTDTKEVVRALKEYFRNYSRPRRIISDRGSCFTSNEFAKFVDDYNISHELIATGSHQANGQVERIFRVITPMCAKLKKDDSWHTTLEEVEFVLNNCLQKSIGMSPSKALFGLEQRGTFKDGIREMFEKEANRNINDIRNVAAENIKKNQLYNEQYFNKKHAKPRMFITGELVMIRNTDTTTGISKKTVPKMKGPFEIKKALGNDRYEVGEVDGFQLGRVPYKGVIEAKNMRLYE